MNEPINDVTDYSINRYRFLLSLLLEHRWSYMLGGVMVGLTLWMTLTIPEYLQLAIDTLRIEKSNNSSTPDQDTFFAYVLWILVFAIVIIITRSASRMLFFTPGRKVEFDLKNRLLKHLTMLQRDYFLANPTGSIISRVNNDINGVRMLMGFGLLQLSNTVFMLSLAPYRMYQVSAQLTLYVALPVLLAFFLLQLAIRRLRRLQQEQMHLMQNISEFTVESYNGLDVLRSYRALLWAERQFGGLSEAIRSNAVKMSKIRAFFVPVLTHVVNVLKVLLIFVGGMMVIEAQLSMGEFMAYTLYLTMLLPPLMGMTFMLFVLQRGMTALSSLETVFATKTGLPVVKPEQEQQLQLQQQLQTGLQVRNLTYAYPDDALRTVLKNISFEIKPGEIVGIFGGIGAGKTTLVNLLNRYLPPPADSVTLDNIDITELSQQRVRQHIVTVSQEPFLFSASIRDNVRFAAETVAAEQLETALQAAAMQQDLARFPAGLETVAGEKGVNLSGGQKQRIALARSLLKPCDLLILDDVLSAVDHETERYLIKQIYGFRHARSLLIVSHRTSVLERADRIVVLEQGQVTAVGTHAELIQQTGIYQQAYQMQSEQAA